MTKIYMKDIKSLCNCITFQFIENDHKTFNSYSKKGLNNWIELYNNDRFKTKKEKHRINYYINKLNEFERLLSDD